MEEKGDNIRITLSGIYVAAFIAFITLIETANPSSLSSTFRILIYLVSTIPVSGFLAYLVFIPLKYKTKSTFIFRREFWRWRISSESIDSFYNFGAGILPSTFMMLLTSILLIVSLTFITNTTLDSTIQLIIGLVLFALNGLVSFVIHRLFGIQIVTD
jgi:hypothetical protein